MGFPERSGEHLTDGDEEPSPTQLDDETPHRSAGISGAKWLVEDVHDGGAAAGLIGWRGLGRAGNHPSLVCVPRTAGFWGGRRKSLRCTKTDKGQRGVQLHSLQDTD